MDRAEYDARGFLHVRQVLTEDDLAPLRAQLVPVLPRADPRKGWTGSAYAFTAVDHVDVSAPACRTLGESPAVMGAVEALIGPAKLCAATLIVKPPKHGAPFPLHQDSAYYGRDKPHYCIVCIPLQDTTAANGALCFLPGAHRQGVLPHVREQRKPHLDPTVYRPEDTVCVETTVGDVVCFNIHTPHASGQNTTNRPRTLVRLGYVPRQA